MKAGIELQKNQLEKEQQQFRNEKDGKIKELQEQIAKQNLKTQELERKLSENASKPSVVYYPQQRRCEEVPDYCRSYSRSKCGARTSKGGFCKKNADTCPHH